MLSARATERRKARLDVIGSVSLVLRRARMPGRPAQALTETALGAPHALLRERITGPITGGWLAAVWAIPATATPPSTASSVRSRLALATPNGRPQL